MLHQIEDLPGEIWKPIIQYIGLYEVSSEGKIKSIARSGNSWTERIIKTTVGTSGYERTRIREKDFFIHRLVATAFIENPLNYEYVNHIDGNKLNNNQTNLEWCDHAYNMKHAFNLGLINRKSVRGQNSISAKITDETAIKIKNMLKSHYPTFISRELNVSVSIIENIKRGITWRHLT